MCSQKRLICRLCFNVQDAQDDEFKAIEDDMKDIVDIVLQKIDFVTIQDPVMCTNCTDMLIQCFDFKGKCINTYAYLTSFINKDTVKLDLMDVYMSRHENDTGVLEVKDVCGLCMSPLIYCSILSIEGAELKKMIEQCVPELDMNIIKKPAICLPCHVSLENYFRFLSGCLIVEEIIKNHCESQNMDSNGAVDLSRLLQFTITDDTRNAGGSWTDLIKVKDEFCEEIENADGTGITNGCGLFGLDQAILNDHDYCAKEFKLKSGSFMDTNELKFNSEHFTQQNISVSEEDVIKIEEPFCEKNRYKQENLLEMKEDQKCLFNEEVEIKTDESDFNRFEESKVSNDDPKIHLLMNNDPLEVTAYKCELCSFQTKHKSYLEKHSLVHKDYPVVTMYKCDSCLFVTKYEKNLDRHLVKHMYPLEVTMYKCDSCLYQSMHKGNFKKHLLKHKGPSEVTMYKCDSCSYQTKCKYDLNKHLITHKDPSEVTMYKCDSCLYQSMYKGNFKKHLLKHKNPSEVKMFKCDSCSYQTKCKYDLKKHLLKHKDPSEVKMFKCDSCLYQSMHKSNFKKHLLKHKDPQK